MMKTNKTAAFANAVLLAACVHTGTVHHEPQSRNISEDRQETAGNLIIFYAPETGSEALLEAVRKQGAELVYDYRNFNGIAVRLPRGADVEKLAAEFRAVNGVLSVEKDRVIRLER